MANKTIIEVPKLDDEEENVEATPSQILETWKQAKQQLQQEELKRQLQAKNDVQPSTTPTALPKPSLPRPVKPPTPQTPQKPQAPQTPTTPVKQNPGESSPKKTSPSALASAKIQPIPADAVTVLASVRQKGNPVLNNVKHIKIEYREDVLPDYIISKSCCVLYISLKYHKLHPQYLAERIRQLNNLFSMRIILCQVDLKDHMESILQDITEIALLGSCTVILSNSYIESARLLEMYRLFEKKSARTIQTKIGDEFVPRVQDCLTSVRSVNKTDVVTLLNNFGTVKDIMSAPLEELSLCPGFGEKKVKRLFETFNAPFTPQKNTKKKQKQSTLESFFTPSQAAEASSNDSSDATMAVEK